MLLIVIKRKNPPSQAQQESTNQGEAGQSALVKYVVNHLII